jgi:hypothetical protein
MSGGTISDNTTVGFGVYVSKSGGWGWEHEWGR